MAIKKKQRDKRRVSLSQYFQELKEGDKVVLMRNLSFKECFPSRLNGTTGTVLGKQGNAYIVRLLNGNKYKTFTIHPMHIKKIK